MTFWGETRFCVTFRVCLRWFFSDLWTNTFACTHTGAQKYKIETLNKVCLSLIKIERSKFFRCSWTTLLQPLSFFFCLFYSFFYVSNMFGPLKEKRGAHFFSSSDGFSHIYDRCDSQNRYGIGHLRICACILLHSVDFDWGFCNMTWSVVCYKCESVCVSWFGLFAAATYLKYTIYTA